MITSYPAQEVRSNVPGKARVDYSSTDDRVNIEYRVDDANRFIIQCDSEGVYIHKKVNGSWTYVPQSIARGGTGGATRHAAAVNLGLEEEVGAVMEGQNVPIFGIVTNNGAQLLLSFPAHRHLYAINNIAVNTLHGVLRGDKGYLDSNNGDRNLIASPFSATAAKRHTGLFVVTVNKTSAFTNVTNNTPITLMATYKFTLT